MLKSIFKNTGKVLLWILPIPTVIVLSILLWLAYLKYAPRFYIQDNNPNIYNAPYLDKSVGVNDKQRVFLVKNGFFQKSTCQSLEYWAKHNLNNAYNLDNNIQFVRYHNELAENYAFKDDYPFIISNQLICEMDSNKKECYVCFE